MEPAALDDYRRRLQQLRAELRAAALARRQAGQTVELDTGRLSRIDALQGQAMAQAGAARAELLLRRVEAALARCEDGSFCSEGGGEIAPGRLDFDPTATFRIGCAESRER